MSKIKKAMIVFAILIVAGDHPKIFVKRDKYVEYMMKWPPYVEVSIGSVRLPIETASIKKEEGNILYENCLAQKLKT